MKTTVDLKEVLDYQAQFDNLIFTNNGVNYQKIKDQSHLALMTELMELCNEIRCFNYWSTKHRNNDAEVLSELADSLSFAYSEAIQRYNLDHNTKLEIECLEKSDDKEKQTLKFLEIINLYNQTKDVATMKKFLTSLIELGYLLGYDFQTQVKAHHDKCDLVKQKQAMQGKRDVLNEK